LADGPPGRNGTMSRTTIVVLVVVLIILLGGYNFIG
jgi:hypothetical protein